MPLFKTKTVDGVLANINKQIQQLEDVLNAQTEEGRAKALRAEALNKEVDDHFKEADRAGVVASKLRALIS